MSIRKRQLKNGKTVYDMMLRTPAGVQISRTFPTRKAAETFEATEKADRARGGWIDPRKAATTFAEVAAQWLDANPAKRPGPRRRDEGVIRKHTVPAIGRRPLGSLTPADVQALVNAWCQSGAAANTVRRQYGTLHAICQYAVLCDLIARTPCRGIKLPSAPHVGRRIVTGEELAALAYALGPEYGPMVYIGAVLGLRWGEVAGLVGRLDFLRFTLTVAEQVTQDGKGGIILGPPKSAAGRRTLAVPGALMDLLSEHLSRRGVTGAEPEAFVFTASRGGPLDYSHRRNRVWRPAVAAVGLTGLTFHDLRRAAATGLVAEGVDLKTAQTRLGHADPRLTLAIYAQATTEADRAAADRLGARFMLTSERRPG